MNATFLTVLSTGMHLPSRVTQILGPDLKS